MVGGRVLVIGHVLRLGARGLVARDVEVVFGSAVGLVDRGLLITQLEGVRSVLRG